VSERAGNLLLQPPPSAQPTVTELVTVGSLCTGIAGLDLGTSAALGGARLAWVADNDPDITFLTAVDQAGIEYTDAQEAVAVGRQVCDYLHAGHPAHAAARALKISNRSLSVKNAARFVTFAQTAYCPN